MAGRQGVLRMGLWRPVHRARAEPRSGGRVDLGRDASAKIDATTAARSTRSSSSSSSRRLAVGRTKVLRYTWFRWITRSGTIPVRYNLRQFDRLPFRHKMRGPMRNILTASLLLLLGAVLAAQVTDKDLLNPDPNDFLLYSGTYDSQRHSLLKQINTSNVGTLQAKWIFHLTGAKDLEAPPIVYKGVMYVGQYNRVHALDAATGRLIWEHMRQPASVGWQRGIGIYGDMVYMVGAGFRARRARSPHRQSAVGSAPVAAGQAVPGPDAVCRQGPGHHERQRPGRRLHRSVRREDRRVRNGRGTRFRSRASRAAKHGRAIRGGTAAARSG